MRGLMMAAMAMTGVAQAGPPDFDPRARKAGMAGAPTEILVLGTPHLSGMPPAFRARDLSLLLDRLAAWKPDIVTIESLSGPECEMLVRYKAIYKDTADTYCWDPAPARAATGLDMPAATAEAERLLAAWPAAPTAAQRRRLAAVFLAGGDRSSALVQWLRLPPAERRAGDGLDAELVALLAALPSKPNENYQIAVALAVRLGLERVHPTDDHTADAGLADAGAPFDAALKEIWSAAGPRLAEMKEREKALGTPEGALALYRFHNSPRAQQLAEESDFGAALRHRTPQLYGRQYLAWWEVRNLRMVANIRATAMRRPGARVLSVVGSSHKGYFEAYLDMMHDVRIADISAVLK